MGAGNETVLYSFTFGVEGQFPTAGLIRDTAGNFYGTTPAGGGNFSYGTIFKLKLNTGGTRGAVSVIHTFKGADGATPSAGLLRDGQGNLCGTTRSGGTFNIGTVFKLDAAGKEIVLHGFFADRSGPKGGLIRDAAGNLYGTTYQNEIVWIFSRAIGVQRFAQIRGFSVLCVLKNQQVPCFQSG